MSKRGAIIARDKLLAALVREGLDINVSDDGLNIIRAHNLIYGWYIDLGRGETVEWTLWGEGDPGGPTDITRHAFPSPDTQPLIVTTFEDAARLIKIMLVESS